MKHYSDNDLDGVGCGILSKIAFGEEVSVDYCSNNSIDRKIKKRLKEKPTEKDNIYITDISVNSEVEKLLEKEFAKNRFVKLIDHHKTAYHLNKREWAEVNAEHKDGSKSSATSLYYEYLIENGLIKKTNFLDQFVEYVRLYDTWDWERENVLEAKKLNDLFYILGLSKFEELILKRVDEKNFEFSETEKLILELEEKKIERYISMKENQMILTWYKNFKIGIVYGEQYTSELGNELNKKHPYLDFILIINYGTKNVSFRTIYKNVDVSKIAKEFGGGGHPQASGARLNHDFFEKFVLKEVNTKRIRKDYQENKLNTKENQYMVLYKDRYDEDVSIYKENDKWHIFKNKINIASNFKTFEEAEHFLKRSLNAFMQKDDFYIRYLVKKYKFKEASLRSQFERAIKESGKEVLK